MSELRTPDSIIAEMAEVAGTITRGIERLREAEERLVDAKLAAERAELTAFLEAQGTVSDRQAVSKIRSEGERYTAEMARVEVGYLKAHLDQLRGRQTNLPAQARLIESMYRGGQ